MRKERSIILYFFLGLIILFGLATFFMRAQIVDYISRAAFSSYDNLVNSNLKTVNKEAVDLKILADKRFAVLRNQVTDFDYDNFDKGVAPAADSGEIIISQPDNGSETASSTLTESTASSSATTTTTTTTASGSETKTLKIRVGVGNNSPFGLKTK